MAARMMFTPTPKQHMRAVKLAVDHAIEQDFPVRLRLERHEQTLVEEASLFICDREQGHVCELDETEGQLVLLERKHLCKRRAGEYGRHATAEIRRFICDAPMR
jgi:hypothetical protein